MQSLMSRMHCAHAHTVLQDIRYMSPIPGSIFDFLNDQECFKDPKAKATSYIN